MISKIFKIGRHTLSLIHSPSSKLFAIKPSKNSYGDIVVALHLGKIGGWYRYQPRA